MTSAAFFSAVLALLLTPGPTNTLMGVAGAQNGLRGVAKLLPAELLGYLSTTLPLVFIGAELLARWPVAAVALKVAAAAWVMFLAVKLWGGPDAEYRGAVTAGRVYLTTMLNPKALVFGLVLFPAPADPLLTPRLAMFCLMVIAVALIWGFAGTLTQAGHDGGRRMMIVQRLASAWLAIVSLTLIAGVIGA